MRKLKQSSEERSVCTDMDKCRNSGYEEDAKGFLGDETAGTKREPSSRGGKV